MPKLHSVSALLDGEVPMIIDICSGTGRFPGEEVINIDINRETKPTIIADINHLPLKKSIKPRLCHVSPPCTYISKARRWRWGWNPKGIAESLRIIASAYDAFAWLEPETCSIEQPAGIEQILGTKLVFKYDKADIKNTTTNFYMNKKSQKRAIIPLFVREKILEKYP